MRYQELLWKSTSNRVTYYELLWISMNYHELSRNCNMTNRFTLKTLHGPCHFKASRTRNMKMVSTSHVNVKLGTCKLLGNLVKIWFSIKGGLGPMFVAIGLWWDPAPKEPFARSQMAAISFISRIGYALISSDFMDSRYRRFGGLWPWLVGWLNGCLLASRRSRMGSEPSLELGGARPIWWSKNHSIGKYEVFHIIMLSGRYWSPTNVEEEYVRRFWISFWRPSSHFEDVTGFDVFHYINSISGHLRRWAAEFGNIRAKLQ